MSELAERAVDIFTDEMKHSKASDPRTRAVAAMKAVIEEVRWSARDQAALDERLKALSPKEIEVLEALALGETYKQIAYRMGLAESTVRTHLHGVYEKLGVVDRAQAALLYLRASDRVA